MVLAVSAIGSIFNTAGVLAYNTTTHGGGPIAASAAGVAVYAVVTVTGGAGQTPATPTLVNHSALPFTLLTATSGTNPTNDATATPNQLGIWGCLATGTTSDDVDLTYTGNVPTGACVSFFQISGFSSAPANIGATIKQLKLAIFASGVSTSLSLSAFANANNIYVFAVGGIAVPAAEDIVQKATATEIHDLGIGSPNRGLGTSWKLNDTAPSAAWTTPSVGIALALEIDSTGGGAAPSGAYAPDHWVSDSGGRYIPEHQRPGHHVGKTKVYL